MVLPLRSSLRSKRDGLLVLNARWVRDDLIYVFLISRVELLIILSLYNPNLIFSSRSVIGSFYSHRNPFTRILGLYDGI